MTAPADGLILVDKPEGLTSAAVVSRLRRYLKMRRVGHTGTLDPFATGVLPICFGRATGAAGYLLGWDKSYRAEILLGQSTDTMDSEGEILEEAPRQDLIPFFEFERIQPLVSGLTSETRQRAPLYSAVKIDGKPLYKYARQGQEVDRPVRDIRVYRSELISVTDPGDGCPRLTVEMTVSSGTYIRSLADLLGRKLGVFAHATALRRLSVGRFDLGRAIPLDQLEALFTACGEDGDRFRQAIQERGWILPVGSVFLDWPRMDLKAREALDLTYGRTIASALSDTSEAAFFYQDQLVAVGTVTAGQARVKRVFMTPDEIEKKDQAR